jgi:hypothetical protein
VMDRLREVDSRPETRAAFPSMRSRSLSGFAGLIEMTGLDPINLGETR